MFKNHTDHLNLMYGDTFDIINLVFFLNNFDTNITKIAYTV